MKTDDSGAVRLAYPALTLPALVRLQAELRPEAAAILAPGRLPLTYRGLLSQIEVMGGELRAQGFGRGDPVAIVLPNGPELAVTFMAVAAVAAGAPLNPDYRQGECEFFLGDLNARALVTLADMDGSARAAAGALGIPVLGVRPLPNREAGLFAWEPRGGAGGKVLSETHPEDVALLLHTSGTTSRPKLVPLTQANVCASAWNISRWLDLGPDDRCLNVMPLFHVHGLIAAVLASLAAGAGVSCTSGFSAPDFARWLAEQRPTWYTAVPTMHQAILERAKLSGQGLSGTSLRFIRSCSAALSPTVLAEMEATFGVPVLEAYGMTEAAHQVCSNPLPPAARRPGSVGVATGIEVAIVDAGGERLSPGETGEVVIRGPNVMAGYVANPAANEAAFVNGWLRTGDLGSLDAASYLYLRGRLKEQINRGGEKVSPREVDEVLLSHPAVAQALAFAYPDARLGEEIGAAVVLRPGAAATEGEIRAFAARQLSDFKVPRRVVFLDNLPKGPTGKPQRLGLAQTLGLTSAERPQQAEPPEYVAPRTPVEETLART